MTLTDYINYLVSMQKEGVVLVLPYIWLFLLHWNINVEGKKIKFAAGSFLWQKPDHMKPLYQQISDCGDRNSILF